MRDFPFDNCPTASDLRAFLSSDQDGELLSSEIAEAIAKHLETCLDCARVRKDLGSFARSKTQAFRGKRPLTDAARELLEAQRRELAAMLNRTGGRPEVGQVWTTKHSWSSSSASNPVIAMLVVVLRIFTRPFTNSWVVDVAPVTEDLTLAAEWSLVFPDTSSGIRTPVVAHLDFQVTTSLDVLGRCLGKLSSRATRSLLQALEAYDEGTSALVPIESAYFGHEAVRNRPEWASLQHELQLMVRAFAKLIPDESSGEFESDFEQAIKEETLHEVLPRAPTSQTLFKWGLGRESHDIGNRAPLNAASEGPTLPGEAGEQFRIDWEKVMAYLQDPQTCKPTRLSSSQQAREGLQLFVSGHRVTLSQLDHYSAATLLGHVIVSYVLAEGATRDSNQNATLPSPEELRSVENLPASEVLNSGSEWRDRIRTVTGRSFSAPAWVLFDQSIKFARRESLRGVPLLSQAARRQNPA